MDEAAVRTMLEEAERDDVGMLVRAEVCRALASSLRTAGETMWVGGYLIGDDRPARRSPFGFGSDAAVGLATVVQVAGELIGGAVTLMEKSNLYAGLALLRQIVEVEYLAWAFAEDDAEAATWLRSSPKTRREMWQPRHLRERSQGRFRATDYGRHCEKGGHPTPDAMTLLPGHAAQQHSGFWWFDLATHGVSTWNYAVAGADRLGYGDLTGKAADTGLPDVVARWRHDDPLHGALATWAEWKGSFEEGLGSDQGALASE
jgi:hypothetical protein